MGFDELFERSDIVSLHLRLSDSTRGIVGRRQLELLGGDGHLINTARSGLVDADALVAALGDGTIAGAGLDVFETEPLPPDDPLLRCPNVVLSPHMGFVGLDSYISAYSDAVEDIRAWRSGDPVRVLR